MANTRSRPRPERRVASIGLVLGLVCIAPVQFALAEERCGWLENPTPGNWWLRDARGLWIISAQGGPYAEGVESCPSRRRTVSWRPTVITGILAPALAELSTITRRE